MSFVGEGAVAIWHDIAPEGLDEFYAWHGGEHMPERVGIPGFNRGRRWVAIEADRRFFNLYETRDAEVVRGPDYLARLDRPTPWTLSTVPHFRRVARSLCRVVRSIGGSDGGLAATCRFSLDAEEAASREAEIADSLLPALAALPGIAAAHFIAADLAASGYVNAEQRARGSANETPSHAIVVEGWGEEAAFIDALRPRLAAEAVGSADAILGFYRCQATAFRG